MEFLVQTMESLKQHSRPASAALGHMLCAFVHMSLAEQSTSLSAVYYSTLGLFTEKTATTAGRKNVSVLFLLHVSVHVAKSLFSTINDCGLLFYSQHWCTWTACIILATSTLVFPFTGFPFTPVISSPAASVPSRAAGVLSKTCETSETKQLKRCQCHPLLNKLLSPLD